MPASVFKDAPPIDLDPDGKVSPSHYLLCVVINYSLALQYLSHPEKIRKHQFRHYSKHDGYCTILCLYIVSVFHVVLVGVALFVMHLPCTP